MKKISHLVKTEVGRKVTLLVLIWLLLSTPISSQDIAVKFVDVLPETRITFKHDNAATPEKYLIETMGAGCAWIDYDQDGILDIYLVQSSNTPLYTAPQPLRSALYRSNGDGTFTDVTAEAGVPAEGTFGMGVAVGDYDNDGFPDLYVIGWDYNILYRNNGDGTFADVTAKAGVANKGHWGSSAAFFDSDNDGDLDLWIVSYVEWAPNNNLFCGDKERNIRAYCHPDNYVGEFPTLFRNNGDGTFTDVSQQAGIMGERGKGLGVVASDFNNDGWTDIFQANDSIRNFLFLNNGDGTFLDATFTSGVGYSEDGNAEAGMGCDAADYNGDGWIDIFVTHLDHELDRLYKNNGDETFDDATYPSKIGNQAILYSGFGTLFFDYDQDGRVDLFVANGHILDNIHLFQPRVSYAEPNLMYRNVGGGFFENVTPLLGPDFAKAGVSRGAALGDYDNDGDLDILISNNGQAPQLLRNDGGNGNHWLAVHLIGTRSNRDGIGTRLSLTARDFKQVQYATGGKSYQAAHDRRIYFGLGPPTMVDELEIRWLSGTVDKLGKIPADQFITVKEGEGRIENRFPKFRAK